MKQRKTMRLWQMIVILILSIAMLVTMFLPAFSFSGKTFTKMQEKNVENAAEEQTKDMLEDVPVLGDAVEIGEKLDEAGIDNVINTYESEYGAKIQKISPLNIMTKSFVKLVGKQYVEDEKLAEDPTFTSIQKKYNIVRIFLWVTYGLLFIVIIILILGFALKWSKFISLTIDVFYSVMVAILFGYMRFMMMRGIAKLTGENLFDNIIYGKMKNATASMLGSIYSIAFLVALIVAILMLIFSILSMFIGNRQPQEEPQEEHSIEPFTGEGSGMISSEPPVRTLGPNEHFNGGGGNSWNEPPKVIKQAPKPMGLVRCTKGVAVGTGFSLPQDRKVIVGKSPQNANLVINNINVSNVHCSIRYNAATNTYFIKDHSMNGTFVNGIRLQKDATMEFPAGTVLSLADGSNEITLG
ncbi:MAG: FHA domain-containing protein [Lachnospiraceae bacterium]